MGRMGGLRRCALGGSWIAIAVIGCGSEPAQGQSTGTSEASTGAASDASASASTATEPDGMEATGSGSDPATSHATSAGGSSTGDAPVPATCGVLEGIPSEPAGHVAQIEALGDDVWLPLGPPAGDPEHGTARGRSWGGRALVLAPDLRGAFYTGEGIHAYVKPDGHGMDDVWFYDIHAHAWIAVHPGTNTVDFTQRVLDGELSIDENGQLQDGDGHPVPVHVLIHAWDFLTYDSATQRFAFIAGDGMGRYYMPGLEAIEEGLSMLEGQREGIDIPPMSPWFYSTEDCAFERYPITTPRPDVGSYSAFVHASATDQYVNAGAGGVAVFDRTSNEWTSVEDTGPRPTGYDHGVAYDEKRNRIYMGSGDGTTAPGVFIYDIQTATWTKPDSAGPAPATFRTNNASIFYDAVSDVVTVFHYSDGVHYTYDPEADSWASQDLPAEILVSGSHNAFYDPVLNTYFVYMAGDSADNGTMFAYRYRNP
jgi:hypothetical protein